MYPPTPSLSCAYRFGPFEADTRTGELRLDGKRIPCQEIPFRFLAALLERPGEMVSRQQLRERIWPGDLNLDFERALDTAAFKARQALGDSAKAPVYLETLPGKGYRFLGAVTTDAVQAPPEILEEFQLGESLGGPFGLVTWLRQGGSLPGARPPEPAPAWVPPRWVWVALAAFLAMATAGLVLARALRRG